MPGSRGSIRLTSTAIRLRSTSTTPAGDRQVVGEDLDLVRLGSIQLDDGAAAQPHYLMDGHGCGAEDHHEIDADVIEGWHLEKT